MGNVASTKKAVLSNIVWIGLVSLFVDMSTEMVYPLIPIFLTAALGATPAIVGVIEGVAESIASLLKVCSGYIGDVSRHKKRLTLIGYSASVVYKVILYFAGSWVGVLAARVIDRTGKGIRTAPRDALVAQSSEKQKLGGSYGLHKMLDMAGSSLGNSSNTFLLLKAQERGFSAAKVMLLYLLFNVSASLLSIPAGKLSDRFGRSAILVPGYFIYGLVYLGFALLASGAGMIMLFIAYGAYTAFISGAERAFIAEAAPDGFKGTVLGIYGMLQGSGLLLSSLVAGMLWDAVNSDAPFWFGGVLGILSAVIIAVILHKNRMKKPGNESPGKAHT